MQYSTGKYCVFYHRYHLVWSTKYRFKVLQGPLRLRVRDICRQVLCVKRRRDYQRRALKRPRSYVRVGAAKTGDQRPDAATEWTFVVQDPARIPSNQKALLGPAFLESRVFFNHQRRDQADH